MAKPACKITSLFSFLLMTTIIFAGMRAIKDNFYFFKISDYSYFRTLKEVEEGRLDTDINNITKLSSTIAPAKNDSELLYDDDVTNIEEVKEGVDHSRPYHYSLVEVNIMFALPIVSSFLSILGSSTIISMLLRRHKKYRLSSTYNRIIFGMSVTDILSSTANILSTLPSPADIDYRLNKMRFPGYGTTLTCTIQGYFFHSGQIGTALYYCALSIYYIIVVTTKISKETLTKRIEPFLHAIPILYSFGSGLFLAIDGDFNTATCVCWIAPYPIQCRKNPDRCLRGRHAILYRWIFAGIPVFLVFFTIIICMTILIRSIEKQHLKMQRYDFSAGNDDPNTTTSRRSSLRVSFGRLSISKDYTKVENSTEAIVRKKKASSMKVKRTTTQALFYITAYFTTYIFAFIFQLVAVLTHKVILVLYLLEVTTAPLQGFLNFLVFIRPQIQNFSRNNPDISFFRAFLEVIKSRGKDPDEERRRRSGVGSVGGRRRRSSTVRLSHRSSISIGDKNNSDSKASSNTNCSNVPKWRRMRKKNEKPTEHIPFVQKKMSPLSLVLKEEIEEDSTKEISMNNIYNSFFTTQGSIIPAKKRMSARSAALQARKELMEEMDFSSSDDDDADYEDDDIDDEGSIQEDNKLTTVEEPRLGEDSYCEKKISALSEADQGRKDLTKGLPEEVNFDYDSGNYDERYVEKDGYTTELNISSQNKKMISVEMAPLNDLEKLSLMDDYLAEPGFG